MENKYLTNQDILNIKKRKDILNKVESKVEEKRVEILDDIDEMLKKENSSLEILTDSYIKYSDLKEELIKGASYLGNIVLSLILIIIGASFKIEAFLNSYEISDYISYFVLFSGIFLFLEYIIKFYYVFKIKRNFKDVNVKENI